MVRRTTLVAAGLAIAVAVALLVRVTVRYCPAERGCTTAEITLLYAARIAETVRGGAR